MFDTEKKLILTVRDYVDEKFNEIDDKLEDMNKKASYGNILEQENYKPYYRDAIYAAEVDVRNLYKIFEEYKMLVNVYDDCCDVIFGIEKDDETTEVDDSEDEHI